MNNHIDETSTISEWKDDLESCARDFLKIFTIKEFDQQFHLFLARMRKMSLSHVNQTNSDLENLNKPTFYNTSKDSSGNSAEYQGKFNHGELHSQIHNVTSQVENYEHPEEVQSKQDNLDMSVKSNVTPLPGIGQRSEFQNRIYKMYPVVGPMSYLNNYPLLGANNVFKDESKMDHDMESQISIDLDYQSKVQRSVNALNAFREYYKVNGLFKASADNSTKDDVPVMIDVDIPAHNSDDDSSDISSDRSSGYSSDQFYQLKN